MANGNRSGKSTRDYCTRFWTHDIYDGSSSPNRDLAVVFAREQKSALRLENSWDGYQHNMLLMNLAGQEFLEVGYLMGISFEFDSRMVIAADIDLDGKQDLLVTEHTWDPKVQTLHVLQNLCPNTNNWIGVRLREEGAGFSPQGARIMVKYPLGVQTHAVVTGDSFSSQHPTSRVFGLRDATSVESIEVIWSNGTSNLIRGPEINRYHDVRAGQ